MFPQIKYSVFIGCGSLKIENKKMANSYATLLLGSKYIVYIYIMTPIIVFQ